MAYLVKNGAILTISGDPIVAPTSGDSSVNNRPVQTITPTESQQIISYSSPYTGLEGVIVQAIPSQYIIPTGTKSITSNGTDIDVTEYATVDVAVPTGSTINNKPSQTIVPTESQQIIGYSSPYTGLEEVIIDAISSTYVGSGISRKSSTDLTASGATITAPAGYYAASASFIVDAGTINNPTATKSAVSNNSITVTPHVNYSAGFINTSGTRDGTAVTVSASELVSGTLYCDDAGNWDVTNAETFVVDAGTATGPTSLSGSSATISTGTNTLTLTKTGITTTPTITAGYVSSATASTATVSLTASVTTKAAATYYPSTSDQTISASQYLTGAQTIKGVVVSGLDASKILSGTTVNIGDSADADRITSVTGNVTFKTYYTGSGTPSSSLGSVGDIYLQTS